MKTPVGRVPDKLELRDRLQGALFAYDHSLVAPSS
jgi:hypothetical protein